MAEPATTTAASVAAAVSGITMALLGVDYHAVLYGFVGALIAVSQSQHTSRWRAVVSVVLSTVTGAVLGTAVVHALGLDGRASVLLGCIVGGAGAQALVLGLVRAAESRVSRMGDKP
jgi:urea transporter